MNPFWLLLLILVGAPLFELYLLIQVGSVIGALPTIVLSVFTAVLGALLMRQQGFAAAQRAQQAMARGEMPALELLEGVLIFLAGAVLLFPGFVTDALGFLLLISPLRRRLLLALLKRAQVIQPAQSSGQQAGGQRYIEGEFRREDE
ncbi:MAG: FxsA family protein [Gammaproteobacteria bacterium]|nr:FxsA family protein [Gammaproteobacteria bacterium]